MSIKTFGKRTAGSPGAPLPRPSTPVAAPAAAAPLQAPGPRAPQGGAASADPNSVQGKARDVLRNALFKELLDVVDLAELARMAPDKARAEVGEVTRALMQQHQNSLDLNEQEAIVYEISNDVLGLGPLEQLLSRDDIADIMVCGPHRVFIEVGGRIQLTDIKFRDEGQLINVCRRIVSAVGRRVDESSPICDARLMDGSRVAIIVPPLSPDGTTLTIRKFRREKLSLQELVRFGSLSKSAARLIEIISACRCNVLISGGTGSGKSLDVDAKVLAPTGWRRMGDVKVGDPLMAPDGKVARVQGVYPQGELPMFEVEFTDGRKVRCSDDHLWKVWTRVSKWCPVRKQKVRDMGWRVVPTSEIRGWFDRNRSQLSRTAIPLVDSFAMEMPPSEQIIPAYVLGAFIGDGGMSQRLTSFTGIDGEVIQRIHELMPSIELVKRPGSEKDHYVRLRERSKVSSFRTALVRLGLQGKLSHEKFLPPEYKLGSISQRTALIQGLMDTDGTVDKAGIMSYATSSYQLAKDIQEVIWSLGGISSITAKSAFYTHKGERLQGRTCYRVWIKINDASNLVTLPRKVERCKNNPVAMRLKIVSIREAGRAQAQCIAIDHPEHLYVTDGYVVTHNTTLLNCVTRFIDPGERIITIEDAMELQLQQPHVVRWETRPPNLEGVGEITMSMLVKAALRHRPERIIIGEVRGKEAFDLLQAMNTGHDGSAGTVHSNSPREAIGRLESMIAMGGWGLPAKQVREQIVGSLDIVIQATRLRDGSRRVTHITEVVGMEGETPTLQDLMVFEQQGEDSTGKIIGRHKMTGMRPHMFEKARGYMMDRELMVAMQDGVKD